MLKDHRQASSRLVACSLLAAAILAAASPSAAASRTAEPGASLLIPYFEVELDQPDGLTTLFSVSNASSVLDRQVLAHAVIWSDWGIPVYSWDFYLAPGDMVSYNLRDLLAYGNLPSTTPPVSIGASCTRPLQPSLTPQALATLQQKLTGRPDPATGQCSSEPRQDTTVATGSITIDYVTDCARFGVDDPYDHSYFDTSQALAGKIPSLVGDFFLVDPAADLAEGYSAMPLHLAEGEDIFFWSHARGDLRRAAPATNWRLRFLQGGPFAARTSFFVFSQQTTPQPEPEPCTLVAPGESQHGIWYFDVYDPSGEKVIANLKVPSQGRRTAARIELDLPDELLSGTVNFRTERMDNLGFLNDFPSVLFGAIEARGRFGVGIFGTPID